jgi:plasmid stability protein
MDARWMHHPIGEGLMPVTLTIKQVPDRLAEKLRARAAASHRSLQGELMVILNEAVEGAARASEPESPAYQVKRQRRKLAVHGRRFTLRELWERSRRLGLKSAGESAAIVRKLRDERHRR